MKKIIPIVVALVVFLLAVKALQPEDTLAVVVAGRDLHAGHTLLMEDLTLQQYPLSLAPQDALNEPQSLVGETLRIDRAAGDAILPAQLGGESLQLAAGERAVAISVDDAAGLAGLLKAGDTVGVTAVIFDSGGMGSQGAFSKTTLSGLRVLYISPDFKALDPAVMQGGGSDSGVLGGGSSLAPNRKASGTVVLAVPVEAKTVVYDFSNYGVPSESRLVNQVELLAALDQAGNTRISLFLEPQDAQSFVSSGLYLPDLVITPGPSPTPTETLTPTPTLVPTATPWGWEGNTPTPSVSPQP